jgi:hypothetical protein
VVGYPDIGTNMGESISPNSKSRLEDLFEHPLKSAKNQVDPNYRWLMHAQSIAEPLATLFDALAQSAEKIVVAGGSTTEEPYRSSLVLATRIIEVAGYHSRRVDRAPYQRFRISARRAMKDPMDTAPQSV